MTPKLLDERYAVFWVDVSTDGGAEEAIRGGLFIAANTDDALLQALDSLPPLEPGQGVYAPQTMDVGRVTGFTSREFCEGFIAETNRLIDALGILPESICIAFRARREDYRDLDARRALEALEGATPEGAEPKRCRVAPLE